MKYYNCGATLEKQFLNIMSMILVRFKPFNNLNTIPKYLKYLPQRRYLALLERQESTKTKIYTVECTCLQLFTNI